MLPFLSKGPGMFLSFFPLDKDLDELCEVSYEREGERITPYDATYTNREAISQVLSSISHHVSFDSTDKELADKLGSLSEVKPVATLVGTFKDSLETQVKAELLLEKLAKEFPKATKGDMEEAVKHTLGDDQVPKQQSGDTADLQSAVEDQLSSEPFKQETKDRLEQALDEKNEALGSIAFNFAELLSFPTDDRCFVPLDNYTGTDTDIDPLRKHLQDVFSSYFKDAKVPIQPSQLLLGIVLRKEYDIVSMEDCIEIGRALNMGEEDVRFTVWFLDFLVGALIYHPEIDDDWFKENIICSPQVVFNSISYLITESLLEIHSEKGSSKHKLTDRKDWIEKGLFSIETVKRCQSEESKEKVREGKLIPVDKLILLLEHSNLLAQITVKEMVGGKEKTKTMSFVPAILECAPPEQLRKSPTPDADTPSPVKITFEPRYVPVGVFCATISRLVSRGRDGILGMKWKLAEKEVVKRNLATFHVDSAQHVVTLVAHVECIEVRVMRKDKAIKMHDLLSYMLSTMLYVIKEISTHIRPIIAFDCTCGGKHKLDNLCRLSPGISTCFTCENGRISLSESQKSWFAKEMSLGSPTTIKALPFAEEDSSLTFKWSRNGPLKEDKAELKLEKVTQEHCEGYYSCEIKRSGKEFISVHHCLKATGDGALAPPVQADTQLPADSTCAEDCLSVDKHLKAVRNAMWEMRADWYDLGVELEVPESTLEEIQKEQANVRDCFTVMLECWLSQTSSIPTWSSLVKALKSPVIERSDIAVKVEALSKGESLQVSDDDLLCVDHLKAVRTATWDLRAHWYDLGVELGVTVAKLQEIQNDYREVKACFRTLLTHWLKQTSPPPTWSSLIEALRSPPVGRNDIADKIELDLAK